MLFLCFFENVHSLTLSKSIVQVIAIKCRPFSPVVAVSLGRCGSYQVCEI